MADAPHIPPASQTPSASSIPPADPTDADLDAFWTRAVTRAGLNPLEVVMGQNEAAALRPSSYAFGATAEEADRLAELVVRGRKRATSSWLDLYRHEDAPLPEVGQLDIITDGRGIPRALVRNVRVTTLPFDEVPPAVAEAEGEGTFEQWRADHRALFETECAEAGIPFDPAGSVVTEYFEVLYSGE